MRIKPPIQPKAKEIYQFDFFDSEVIQESPRLTLISDEETKSLEQIDPDAFSSFEFERKYSMTNETVDTERNSSDFIKKREPLDGKDIESGEIFI